MNENINLTEVLKNCPKGWKFYSLIHGEVQFGYIDHGDFPIVVELSDSSDVYFTEGGRLYRNYDGECVLLPSKNQRDWSKFTAPWYKKDKFDPKTLQPFDKVLAASMADGRWVCDFFSHISKSISNERILYVCSGFGAYDRIIPYNDETKHLVGTIDEATEYYRYWKE